MPWPLGGISCSAMAAVVAARSARPIRACSAARSAAVIAPPLRRAMRRDAPRRSRRGRSASPLRLRRSRAALRAAAGKREALADLRARGPRGRKASAKPGCALQHRRRRGGPLLLHDDRHRVAALGDLDRRLEQVGEGQLAEALATARPSRRPRRAPSPSPSRAPAASPRRRRTCAGSSRASTPPARGPRRSGRAAACRPRGCRRRREPRPLLHGSTIVITAAAAIAASTALPPLPQHAQAGLRRERMRGRDDVAGEHGQARRRVAAATSRTKAWQGSWRVGGSRMDAARPARTAPHCGRSAQQGRDVLADGQRRGQARRFDAEQVDQPRHAVFAPGLRSRSRAPARPAR